MTTQSCRQLRGPGPSYMIRTFVGEAQPICNCFEVFARAVTQGMSTMCCEMPRLLLLYKALTMLVFTHHMHSFLLKVQVKMKVSLSYTTKQAIMRSRSTADHQAVFAVANQAHCLPVAICGPHSSHWDHHHQKRKRKWLPESSCPVLPPASCASAVSNMGPSTTARPED